MGKSEFQKEIDIFKKAITRTNKILVKHEKMLVLLKKENLQLKLLVSNLQSQLSPK